MIEQLTTTKGQIVTVENIFTMLNSARSTNDYAKFIVSNGTYITIDFHRDHTISISTNSRDIGLWTRIESLRNNYSQTRLSDMVFYWINFWNRSLMTR